jgi:hypothetical protein
MTSHPSLVQTDAAPAATPTPPQSQTAVAAVLSEASIAVLLGEHRVLLADGRVARQALSCLIAPDVGDKVLVAACAGNELYVLHLLQRADPALAELSVPGAAELRILQPRLLLQASEQLSLHSLHGVDIGAAAGLLSLHADNMSTTVSQALVQSVKHYVGSAEQYLLDVSELLRLHGQHTMLYAEQDVKIDGRRISVG